VSAVLWAREQLSQNDWAILDTETTGLYDAEIVEIAIINNLGEMLLDALVKLSIPIPAEATDIHGISDAKVADAPTFPEVYPTDAALKDKRVLIYNSAFDIKILNYCGQLHSLPVLDLAKRSDCLMERAAL
jgi:DNA polymerase-3 subunit epsilon